MVKFGPRRIRFEEPLMSMTSAFRESLIGPPQPVWILMNWYGRFRGASVRQSVGVPAVAVDLSSAVLSDALSNCTTLSF
jgi:hypothetical protein